MKLKTIIAASMLAATCIVSSQAGFAKDDWQKYDTGDATSITSDGNNHFIEVHTTDSALQSPVRYDLGVYQPDDNHFDILNKQLIFNKDLKVNSPFVTLVDDNKTIMMTWMNNYNDYNHFDFHYNIGHVNWEDHSVQWEDAHAFKDFKKGIDTSAVNIGGNYMLMLSASQDGDHVGKLHTNAQLVHIGSDKKHIDKWGQKLSDISSFDLSGLIQGTVRAAYIGDNKVIIATPKDESHTAYYIIERDGQKIKVVKEGDIKHDFDGKDNFSLYELLGVAVNQPDGSNHQVISFLCVYNQNLGGTIGGRGMDSVKSLHLFHVTLNNKGSDKYVLTDKSKEDLIDETQLHVTPAYEYGRDIRAAAMVGVNKNTLAITKVIDDPNDDQMSLEIMSEKP